MKKILVLTSRKALGDIVAKKLSPRGYEVRVLDNSSGACPLIKDKKVDFVLFDVELALLEGPKALDTARAQNPDVPVVVTSLIRPED